MCFNFDYKNDLQIILYFTIPAKREPCIMQSNFQAQNFLFKFQT